MVDFTLAIAVRNPAWECVQAYSEPLPPERQVTGTLPPDPGQGRAGRLRPSCFRWPALMHGTSRQCVGSMWRMLRRHEERG